MTEAAAHRLYRNIEHSAPDPRISLPLTPRAARRLRAETAQRVLDESSVLSSEERGAVTTLLQWWPLQPPSGRARAIVDALADTDLLFLDQGGAVVRSEAIARLAPALHQDAAWLKAQGRFSMAALAEVRCARADLKSSERPGTIETSTGSDLSTDGGRSSDPTLARGVLLALSDEADPMSLAEIASALRATLAESNLGLHLLDDDQELLARQRTVDDPHLSDPQFARAMAAAHTRGWTAFVQNWLGLRIDTSLTPVSRDDALRVLVNDARTRPQAAAEDPLVTAPLAQLHELPWRCVANIAGLPDLETRLADLLGQRDWSSFDAPGEGDLPDLWRDALVVAGAWSSAWQEIWSRAFDDHDTPQTPVEVLRGYSDSRQEGSASAHSSYTHGLHDGTSEAYGDVYSPHDPFSARHRKDGGEAN
ncbi:MAG: hypothetical protein ACJAYU_004643 [Bradymonadia bacterium]|jgi:hypothetical protein